MGTHKYKDIDKIRKYLTYMTTVGKGNTPFALLEKTFDIRTNPNSEAGERARKTWKSFQKSGLTIDQYCRPSEEDLGVTDLTISGTSVAPPEDSIERREWTYTDNTAHFSGVTEQSITTLEDALSFCKADMDVWDVDRWKFNSWDVTMKIKKTDAEGRVTHVPTKRTNYSVQVWFKLKDRKIEIIQDIIAELKSSFKSLQLKSSEVKKDRVGVLSISDIHIGADVHDLVKTPDFNIDVIVKHFAKIAEETNKLKYSEVHINFLGDYFESISGLNHLNTFKSLGKGMYGAKVIQLGVELIGNFLRLINNVKGVNIISGNHDRMTPQSDVDNEGSAADMLSYCLQMVFPNLPIKYHTYVLSEEIDGICYLLTHGHFKMDKKDGAKMVKLYGSKDLFTLWLSGHIHARETSKVFHSKQVNFHNINAVSMDEISYRKIILPPIFTGNYYSETLGYTSTGGFVITENCGNGKPKVIDYSL